MNSTKAQRAASPPRDLAAMVPSMSDAGLENMRANAERHAAAPGPTQEQAAALLPVIEDELLRRAAAATAAKADRAAKARADRAERAAARR